MGGTNLASKVYNSGVNFTAELITSLFNGTKNLVDSLKKNKKNIKWFFFASTSHDYTYQKKKIKQKLNKIDTYRKFSSRVKYSFSRPV